MFRVQEIGAIPYRLPEISFGRKGGRAPGKIVYEERIIDVK
jgi:hypothetical protein